MNTIARSTPPYRVEHVGSTAVPGLGAKPIIDILIGVSELKTAEERIPELQAHDYQYVPAYEEELPDRRYFRKPSRGPKTRHLHCVVFLGEYWRNHLAFRDYLRQHTEASKTYDELKQDLAQRYRWDRTAYLTGKSVSLIRFSRRPPANLILEINITHLYDAIGQGYPSLRQPGTTKVLDLSFKGRSR